MMRQPGGARDRGCKAVARGARGQPVGARVRQQTVNIPQVAQRAGQIAIGEQMRGGVDDPVMRAQDAQPVRQDVTVGDQQRGIRRRPRGRWQDGVMDVDHAIADAVDQRRQLVHPAPIIEVVIGIGLHPFPAGGKQCRLHRGQGGLRHENVEIADGTPLPRRQPGRDIGGALQQHDRNAQRGERMPGHVRLPQGRSAFGLRLHRGIGAPVRDRGGDIDLRQPRGERAGQPFGYRDRQHRVPAVGVERRRQRGIGQQPCQQARVRAHAAPAHSRSTSATAASVSG